MTNRVGQHLGNYRLMQLLGQGGFAEVYLGEHVFLRTRAAIKVLQVRLSDDDMEGFLNEARTIANLAHPNILRVLEFGVQDAIPFLVMEYAPNGTLRQRHPKGSVLSTTTIVSYVKQVASALQYVHNKKLIHRDIKPENLLLGANNEVLLGDFGTALVVQTMQQQSIQQLAGTIIYMAPEQIQGKPRAASDQYSLGIIVYEWLCGHPPFRGSFTELYSQQMLAAPPSLREQVSTISHDVEEVVMTTLAKDPQQRFANISAFANALEQASKPQEQSFSSSNVVSSPSLVTLRPWENIPTDVPTFAAPPASVHKSSPAIDPPVVVPMNSQLSNTPSTPAAIPTPTFAHKTPETFVIPEPALSQSKTQSARRVSRRGFVLGGLGLLVVAAAGGVAWLEVSQHKPFVFANLPSIGPAPSPTPTPSKAGTHLFTYKGHDDEVYAVAWSPAARRIASGGNDHTVQVWDAANGGNIVRYYRHSDAVASLAWSPNGQRIVSGSSDTTVQVWDAATGTHIATYKGHSKNVRAVAWSPNSQFIASGGDDTLVQIWNVATAMPVFTYKGHSTMVNSLTWSPDSTYIASASNDKTVQVWNATTGKLLITYKGHSSKVNAVAWAPEGQHIVSGEDAGTVQVWNPGAANGGDVAYYGSNDGNGVYTVAWSPNGQFVASNSWSKVHEWNAATLQTITTYAGHSGKVAVHAVSWSSDGTLIASGSSDHTVQVWNAS